MLGGRCVVARAGERLGDFVSQRGSQFSHHAHAVHAGKIQLQLLQSLQRSRAILDVYQETVPARDTPGLVANWGAAVFKPPIFAVEASQAQFLMKGSTSGQRCLIRFKDTGKVSGMDRIACSPVLKLFDSPAKILDDWAIDGFEFAARSHDRNETSYPVNCCPELRLALPQCLFCALSSRHIDVRADSFHQSAEWGKFMMGVSFH